MQLRSLTRLRRRRMRRRPPPARCPSAATRSCRSSRSRRSRRRTPATRRIRRRSRRPSSSRHTCHMGRSACDPKLCPDVKTDAVQGSRLAERPCCRSTHVRGLKEPETLVCACCDRGTSYSQQLEPCLMTASESSGYFGSESSSDSQSCAHTGTAAVWRATTAALRRPAAAFAIWQPPIIHAAAAIAATSIVSAPVWVRRIACHMHADAERGCTRRLPALPRRLVSPATVLVRHASMVSMCFVPSADTEAHQRSSTAAMARRSSRRVTMGTVSSRRLLQRRQPNSRPQEPIRCGRADGCGSV